MMSQSRIEAFQAMLKDQPDEVMIWYGLGNEYFKLERWAEAADALRNVVRLNPDYTAAYQMLGSALMGAGRRDEARAAWTAGVEAGRRTGAWKAQQHMERLLAESTQAGGGAEFCD
ncbi:MAG TPA: tetratricopeptide repeat protein [Blastocatellia bacterium]|nr:tetratricopeptide repeat protein [Blastocatellia bacterium]